MLPLQGAQVQSLVMELTPRNLAKNKQTKRIWNHEIFSKDRVEKMWEGRFKKLWHCHPEFLLSLESLSSVQLLSCVWLFAASWIAAHQASLSITNSQTHVYWVGDAIRPSHSLSSPSSFPSLQSFPASGSFQMSQFFESAGQSIGISASASVLPMNI